MLIAGPASNVGKTSVTAALAWQCRARGGKVRVFKTGPDFLDPMILERASGHPVYHLDLWMVGEDACRNLLYEATQEADLVLIEGVMGLYDGKPSSADLAEKFGLTVLLVIDAQAMAQTFGAVAHGLATYRPSLNCAGVIANRVASPGHADLLAPSLPAEIPFLGYLARDEAAALPDRHLGLVQARELAGLDQRLERLAKALTLHCEVESFESANIGPSSRKTTTTLLKGHVVAVAKDDAFSFIYPANLDFLRAAGAEVIFFSPLENEPVPTHADAVWLPGGYPELHLERLSSNQQTLTSLRDHHRDDRPILGECGGMLYLLDSLTSVDGNSAKLAGLLSGDAQMQSRLAAIGMQSAEFPEGELRGHAFHYAKAECAEAPYAHGMQSQSTRDGEPVYRKGRLTASFIHFYFPSNPQAAAGLFRPQQAP